jgi:hypothetical protein
MAVRALRESRNQPAALGTAFSMSPVHPHNHSSLEDRAAAEPSPGKDFSAELAVARDAVLRVQGILECIIPEDRKNAYWFQKFAEQRLLPESRRDTFRQWMYAQESLEQGLYLLYDSFINIKNVVTELLKAEPVPYASFVGIGRILSRETGDNRFFNPFKKEINPEFDVIENHSISSIVKAIEDREERKLVSSVFLRLFRFLRYLSHMDMGTRRPVALHSSYLVLLSLRHELASFTSFLEGSAKDGPAGLRKLLDSMSYQFAMESKRVFRQELKDFLDKPLSRQRGKVENSHGILKNLIEQDIIMLAQYWGPELRGDEIFDSFTTRLEQSLRLREDLAVFHRLLGLIEAKSKSPRELSMLARALRNYMQYFESFTFRLLRHDDYEEFAASFAEIGRLVAGTASGSRSETRNFLEQCTRFKIFIETTLGHLANRAELLEKPLDPERVDSILKQYISA